MGTYVYKRINVKRIVAAVIVCIILVLVAIYCVYKTLYLKKMRDTTLSYAKEVNIIKEEEQKRQEEIKLEDEKKKLERFNPLTEEEIGKIETIYEHSEMKRVFLTFDDGPSESVTPFILDLLKQENIKASFFVLGNNVDSYPSIVKREFDEGHFVGNHGTTHRYSAIYESVDTVLGEYNSANESIRKAVENPIYNSLIFRFPGGSNGGYYHELKAEAKKALKEKGIANVDWNALTNDSAGATTNEEIMENFYETVEGKSSIVLLMHDASDKILTYEALPEMIKYFRENQYEFKSLYDAIGR